MYDKITKISINKNNIEIFLHKKKIIIEINGECNVNCFDLNMLNEYEYICKDVYLEKIENNICKVIIDCFKTYKGYCCCNEFETDILNIYLEFKYKGWNVRIIREDQQCFQN